MMCDPLCISGPQPADNLEKGLEQRGVFVVDDSLPLPLPLPLILLAHLEVSGQIQGGQVVQQQPQKNIQQSII